MPVCTGWPRRAPQRQQLQLQKQQTQHLELPSDVLADSPHAGRARELFSECVRAGQWVRFTDEQRHDKEYITLLIIPMAVAV